MKHERLPIFLVLFETIKGGGQIIKALTIVDN